MRLAVAGGGPGRAGVTAPVVQLDPHPHDPHRTLHAAAERGHRWPGGVWPDPSDVGSRRPRTGRTDGPRPRLDLLRRGAPGTRHARRRPGRGPGAG